MTYCVRAVCEGEVGCGKDVAVNSSVGNGVFVDGMGVNVDSKVGASMGM